MSVKSLLVAILVVMLAVLGVLVWRTVEERDRAQAQEREREVQRCLDETYLNRARCGDLVDSGRLDEELLDRAQSGLERAVRERDGASELCRELGEQGKRARGQRAVDLLDEALTHCRRASQFGAEVARLERESQDRRRRLGLPARERAPTEREHDRERAMEALRSLGLAAPE